MPADSDAAERAAEERNKAIRLVQTWTDSSRSSAEGVIDDLIESGWQLEQQRTTTEEALAATIDSELRAAGLDTEGAPFATDGQSEWPVAAELRDRLARAILDAPDVPIRRTQEELIDVLMGEGFGDDRGMAADLADAILASGAVVEAGKPAVAPGALAKALHEHPLGPNALANAQKMVEGFIASGIVLDAADVRREMLTYIEDHRWMSTGHLIGALVQHFEIEES